MNFYLLVIRNSQFQRHGKNVNFPQAPWYMAIYVLTHSNNLQTQQQILQWSHIIVKHDCSFKRIALRLPCAVVSCAVVLTLLRTSSLRYPWRSTDWRRPFLKPASFLGLYALLTSFRVSGGEWAVGVLVTWKNNIATRRREREKSQELWKELQ